MIYRAFYISISRHGKEPHMYIDLLTKLKNAQAAKKKEIKVPYTKMDEQVLEILRKQKFIEVFEKKGRNPKRILDIKLRYEEEGGAITGVRFVSKPSRRLYKGYKELRPVRSGFGTLVLSTPKGIVTGLEARKMKVGGELLFEVW